MTSYQALTGAPEKGATEEPSRRPFTRHTRTPLLSAPASRHQALHDRTQDPTEEGTDGGKMGSHVRLLHPPSSVRGHILVMRRLQQGHLLRLQHIHGPRAHEATAAPRSLVRRQTGCCRTTRTAPTEAAQAHDNKVAQAETTAAWVGTKSEDAAQGPAKEQDLVQARPEQRHADARQCGGSPLEIRITPTRWQQRCPRQHHRPDEPWGNTPSRAAKSDSGFSEARVRRPSNMVHRVHGYRRYAI